MYVPANDRIPGLKRRTAALRAQREQVVSMRDAFAPGRAGRQIMAEIAAAARK